MACHRDIASDDGLSVYTDGLSKADTNISRESVEGCCRDSRTCDYRLAGRVDIKRPGTVARQSRLPIIRPDGQFLLLLPERQR